MADTDISDVREMGEGQTPLPGEAVNLNTASRRELMRLYGVDGDLADRIIAYREEHGRFDRPEDIQKVPGIGSDWYEHKAGRQITV